MHKLGFFHIITVKQICAVVIMHNVGKITSTSQTCDYYAIQTTAAVKRNRHTKIVDLITFHAVSIDN